jgi:hypothetical protein
VIDSTYPILLAMVLASLVLAVSLSSSSAAVFEAPCFPREARSLTYRYIERWTRLNIRKPISRSVARIVTATGPILTAKGTNLERREEKPSRLKAEGNFLAN